MDGLRDEVSTNHLVLDKLPLIIYFSASYVNVMFQ